MRVNKIPINFVLSLIIAIAFVIFPNPGSSGKVYDVLLSDVSATCNPNYCNVSISANGTLISMTFHVLERLNNVFIYVEVGGKSEYGQYHKLTNKTLVLCEFIHDRMRNPFIGMIYDVILQNKENHMFTSCPLMPDTHYYFRNADVNVDRLPPMMPPMRFTVLLKGVTHRPRAEPLVNISFSGSFQKHQLKKRQRKG